MQYARLPLNVQLELWGAPLSERWKSLEGILDDKKRCNADENEIA